MTENKLEKLRKDLERNAGFPQEDPVRVQSPEFNYLYNHMGEVLLAIHNNEGDVVAYTKVLPLRLYYIEESHHKNWLQFSEHVYYPSHATESDYLAEIVRHDDDLCYMWQGMHVKYDPNIHELYVLDDERRERFSDSNEKLTLIVPERSPLATE